MDELMTTATKRDPRWQGDQGERSAIAWFLDQAIPVFMPVGHSPDIDLIACPGPEVIRVQCKTTTQFVHQRWSVSVCTRGGNRSWNGVVKVLDPSRYDYLFVLVADGRRWFIPASHVGGGSCIRLGGPKYAQYEIAPGRPIEAKRLPLH